MTLAAMISSFARSLHVTPPVIMGRRMRPYSAFHQLTLEAFGSPFHFTERGADAASCFEAWLICQDGYADNLKSFRAFSNHRLLRFIASVLMRYHGWQAIERQLREYIASYTFAPRVSASADVKMSRIPVGFHCVAVMVSKGLSLTEAMDMPLCQLICLKVALAEGDGLHVTERDYGEAMDVLSHPEKANSGFLRDFFDRNRQGVSAQ